MRRTHTLRQEMRQLIYRTYDKDKLAVLLDKVYERALSTDPNIDPMPAMKFIFEYVVGRPNVIPHETDERLKTAQAMLIEQQVSIGEVAARVEELMARASRAKLEVEMWPRQFVSEEEEISNLQAIAASVNQPLMAMTPEMFQEMIEGKDYSAALELLKGHLAKGQAQIMAEVMQYKSEGTTEEEEEEE